MKIDNKLSAKHIFMIGIGGISMSGLAKILSYNGYHVSGSDIRSSDITQELILKGIDVKIGHDKNNINLDIDLVVYTGAIKEDNCEFIMAKKLGIQTIERSELLGSVSQQFNHVIAICDYDGCYYYHLWHNDNTFSKIGYSDCLFKEVLYEN